MNVSEILRSTAQKNPDKTALIFGQKKISYQEFDGIAEKLACALFQRGVKKGDPVILMLHNSWEFVVSYFSIARLGAVTVPIDVRLKGDELTSIVTDSGARFLIIHRSLRDASQDFFSSHFSLDHTIIIDDRHGQEDFFRILENSAAEMVPDSEIRDSDEALYYYTSGTTGKPKGVVLTFGNLDWFQVGITPYTTADDIVGYVLPMSHVSGTLVCNEIAYRGSTLCIFDNLRPDKILQTLQQQRVSWFFSVPPIFDALLRVPHVESYSLESLRWIAMMGTTVPVSLMEKFHCQFPSTTVIQGYGLTETNGPFTLVPLEQADAKQGSVGIPIPRAEVKVVNDDGRALPPGDVGEIIVRGPMVMKLYHNDPESTQERIHDGWLYTGDVGRFDQDGFLYHLGRKDDMIIVGGLNVFPAEIENVLKHHPLVADAAAVGISDTDRGQIIKAFVVLTAGSTLTEKEVIAFCRERLASYKLPKLVDFKPSLPRTSTGKVARKLLKEAGH
jgi:acyl-CoA synthetase (AMP-forming)/AMP-acid ligase II